MNGNRQPSHRIWIFFVESVTFWISNLKESGREQAAQELWNRYMSQLLQLARRKLGSAPKTTADEEDVAVKAFAALLDGVRDDRFARLNDRDDLWQILIMLTEHKAIDQRRAENTLKRGGASRPQELPPHTAGPAPSPQLAAELVEEFNARLAELPDELERQIAVKRLQGFDNREIATELAVSLRTVERKVSLIRRTWQVHIQD